jgi:rfaE bifunctional protein, domain II
VYGPCPNDSLLIEQAMRCIADFALSALLITRSEQGMTLVLADGDVHHYAATAREVSDVTGAGDTVVATLAAALAAGLSLADSAEAANRAAGLVVSKLGTATVSGYELERALQSDSGVFQSQEALTRWVQAQQAAGETVVMTNGCFDILHAGHVAYLKEAASLGDRLVVAVNSDASVARLKGPERPVNPVNRRLDVLAGLQAVDAVIAFEDDTPIPLIEALKPDVLVKGGDYKSITEVIGYDRVQAYGGVVRVLGEVADLSTSHLIAKIRQTDSDSTS